MDNNENSIRGKFHTPNKYPEAFRRGGALLQMLYDFANDDKAGIGKLPLPVLEKVKLLIELSKTE